MTTTPAIDRPTRQIDLGHPVRSFVLALVGLAVALLVLQWTGFANPQVHGTSYSGSYSAGPLRTFTAEVKNDSPFPVEVVELAWPTTNMRHAEVGIAPSTTSPDGSTVSYALEPFEPFELAAGESAWVGVRVLPDCPATVGHPQLEVRTASGLVRHVEIDQGGFDLGDPCA